jgi:pimeloyl-ACP methyl ester carboxylesterase
VVRTYYGDDALAIAPSRFGYFGSTLPDGANPSLQADVYAVLLDHLGVERAVVIGFSAGGTSAIEFALQHPDRVDLLVLASSALPAHPIPRLATTIGQPAMRALLSAEWIWWEFKNLLPGTFRRLIGVPRDYDASPAELATIEEIGKSVMPVKPRRDGAVFDTFIGNPHVNTRPLEEIATPTLIVHAADDALAPYKTATAAAARMAHAHFVTIERGGHEFLGREAEVRQAIHSLVESASAGQGTR